MNAPDLLPHEAAAELLPWLINNSLDEDEKEAVLEHARACVICRRELGELERLRDSISPASEASSVPAPDMRSINARIDRLIDRRSWGRSLRSWIRDRFERSWRIVLAAQSVLLIALVGLLLWPEPENPEFTTLTRPNDLPDGLYIRLVFSPEIAQTELSDLLDRFELEVVEGPSTRGVYTLALADSMSVDDRDRLVTSLQADSSILFAQPVIREAGR